MMIIVEKRCPTDHQSEIILKKKKKERKSKDTSKNSPNESGRDNQNGIVKENSNNLDKCN